MWSPLNFLFGIVGVSVISILTWIKTVRNNVVFKVATNVIALFLLVLLSRDIDGRGGCNICEAWNGSDAFQATIIHKVERAESKIDEECYRKFEKASTSIPGINQDGDPFFDFCEPAEGAKQDATWGAMAINSDLALIEPKSGDERPIDKEWNIRFQNPVFGESGVARYRIFFTTNELNEYDGDMRYFRIMCSPQKLQSMTACKVPKLEETEWYQYAVPGTTPRKIYWRVRAEMQNGDARWILDKAEDGKELYFIPSKSQ